MSWVIPEEAEPKIAAIPVAVEQRSLTSKEEAPRWGRSRELSLEISS
jgi:hypothetical protein